MSGLLFADDFVGLAVTRPAMQCHINRVYNYSNSWRFESNVQNVTLYINFPKATEGTRNNWL